MQCKQAGILLDAYIDHELNFETAAQLELHLDDCPSCAAELRRLHAENEVYVDYERRLEFDPALWGGVRSRLAEATQRQSFTSWLIALFAAPRISIPVTLALVLLAVLATAKFMSTANKMSPEQTLATADEHRVMVEPVRESGREPEQKESTPQMQSTPRTEPRRSERTQLKRSQPSSPQQLVREAEMKYLAAIAILSRRVAEREPTLTPEARLKFEETLAAIDRNIAATRQAARKHPEDPMAVHYMLTAYARKVEVMREMTGY
ncbi:MAG TPA: zf-HC2 domain-containing protein [Pyrinomonadaceae bacterium]|nr:zf-HC2 domain-containing protein [Pyrinomonadaceae bacterium]